MPEVGSTLDAATGELTLGVKGVAGPSCDEIAKQLLGEPAEERNTTEYYQHTQVRPLVRPKVGR